MSGSASKNKPKVQSKFLELVQDAVASGSSKEYAVKFRSLVNREIPLTSLSGWKKRLFEVMIQGKGSDENKSAALLEFFGKKF